MKEALLAEAMKEHLRTPRSLRAATLVGDEIRVEMLEGGCAEGDPLCRVVYWFDKSGALSRPVERERA